MNNTLGFFLQFILKLKISYDKTFKLIKFYKVVKNKYLIDKTFINSVIMNDTLFDNRGSIIVKWLT